MSDVQKELARITHGVPKELGSRITKKTVDTTQEDILVNYLKAHDHEIPTEKKRFMWDLVRKGALRHVEEVEDKDVTAKIDRYYDHAIKVRRRDGRLPDPRKDKFFRRHMQS